MAAAEDDVLPFQPGPRSEGTQGAPAASAGAKATHYSKADWWNSRFQSSEETFDWYATYRELEGLFQTYAPPEHSGLLMVGCGNSDLSAELHEAGYRGLVNVDISAAVVAQMAAKHEPLGQEWLAMDATDMSFEDERFGQTVDKGTLDAMMCGSDDSSARKMVSEVWRVLRPNGIFIIVSHSGARREMLNAAVAEHGTNAAWRFVEVRHCRLSPQATLINTLRSKLGDRPMAEAIKEPELLKEAMAETRETLRQMAFLEAFRLFKARKAQHAGVEQEEAELEQEDAAEAMADRGQKRQPFCWVYVLRKS